jgi:hypothetical protein
MFWQARVVDIQIKVIRRNYDSMIKVGSNCGFSRAGNACDEEKWKVFAAHFYDPLTGADPTTGGELGAVF